jgi:hypothetical protein
MLLKETYLTEKNVQLYRVKDWKNVFQQMDSINKQE